MFVQYFAVKGIIQCSAMLPSDRVEQLRVFDQNCFEKKYFLVHGETFINLGSQRDKLIFKRPKNHLDKFCL